MPVQIKLTSGIFDKRKRDAAFSSAVNRTTKEFAAYVPKQQIESKATGKLYARKRGASFRRFHRASAKGQRPAPDTGKLTKSTKHKMTGRMKGEVTTIAKSGNYDYASQLQEEMDRPIQNAPEDLKEAQQMLNGNAEKALNKLA